MSIPVPRPALPLAGVLGWVLLLSAAPAPARAAEGLFVTVPNPIGSEAVKQIRAQVNARVDPPPGVPPVTHVVFDFNPDGKPAGTAEFGPCLDLQDFILNKLNNRVTTVAFVRANVTGHTVLPVLACRELVMSRGATLGPIVGELVPALNEGQKGFYQSTLDAKRRGALGAVVRKMYDRDVQLRSGFDKANPQAKVYIDARTDAARVAGQPAPVPGVPDGSLGQYPADLAKELGLRQGTAETLPELAELYSLPPLRPDPLVGRTPEVFRYVLRKDIDGAVRESVGRVIKDVRAKGGNVLVLVVGPGGNDLGAARDLADDLRAAQAGDDPIKVVAFVPEAAGPAGTVVALGCSEIVMAKPKPDAGDAREAEIGDFSGYLKGARQADADAHLASIRKLAEDQGYPPVLVDGMFKKDLEVLRVRRADDDRASQRRLMTREEFEAANKDKPKPEWVEEKPVKARGQLLKLNATQAVDLGLARAAVDGTDVRAVTAAYGWPDAKDPAPGWLDVFADFLKIPAVTVLLVVIGFTGLILELKVPGLTVPGILAALCFILVFWAHSKFGGQTFVLALLLFLLGLVLVGIEIFVLPGFGAAGIFGVLCMLAGLGLVTVDRVPQTGAEWGGLALRASQYLFAMMGALMLSFFIARFLPKLPGANRLVLTAPSDAANPADDLPGAGEAAGLLGAIGTASTPLRPAGVVKFGDKFVDVVSDGGFVPAGTRVQAVQVEGTRIVVKEV